MTHLILAGRQSLSIAGRVAYVVNHSFPHSSNGYAVRTHGVAAALAANGHSVIVINRPGRPWDITSAKVAGSNISYQQDGVQYLCLPEPSQRSYASQQQWAEAAADALEQAFKVYKPAVVIAASNWENAEPAMLAARRLKLPFYYEVRGFWELSRASSDPAWHDTDDYKSAVAKETAIACAADKVITLNPLMQQQLIKRGVSPANIILLPNGVHQLPAPAKQNSSPRLKVGYIGSFAAYEGLDDLLKAVALLRQSGLLLSLILVGSGNQSGIVSSDDTLAAQQLQAKAEQLGIANWVSINGRVANEQIANYYHAIDVVVNPRRSYPVTELVSSLKPIEAAAYGKPVLLSDVAPNKLLADECSAFTLFSSGDVIDLAAKLKALLSNEELYQRYAEQGYQWVIQQRQFKYLLNPLLQALVSAGGHDSIKLAAGCAIARTASLQRLKQNSTAQTVIPTSEVAAKSAANLQFGDFQSAAVVELSSAEPLWHKIPVQAGQDLIIKAAVSFKNIASSTSRKSVLLLKCYDGNGKEVDRPCGNLSKSGHLKAYFKYLPCTQNITKELHNFTVPAGVTRIHLGLCGFNKAESEQVFVKNLSIKPASPKLQPDQFTPPSNQAAEISIAGWPDYPKNAKPYVLGIMDEFTTGCFEQDLNLIQPRPDNWFALAEKYQPELFFIESAWKGNFGSWQYRVADYANKPGPEVAHLCQYAKSKNIPTLFWNKEDPVHHDKFMCSAKLADYIFTTDANMISSYRQKTGNAKVFALPFAAQPALHKPAPLKGRIAKSCFAGSWYGDRHAERGKVIRWLMDAANKHGLDIYDRNHGTGIFPFPSEYQNGIKGSLPYKALCEEYNRYRIFLNVNSVTDSPTMFSRRVFELMACGTPVVSTYAKGIEQLFESDAVWMVNTPEEAEQAIYTLMTDDAEWRRRSLAGIREVFSKHTYAHRLNDIFEQTGIATRMPTDPKVLLVAEASNQAELQKCEQFAMGQQYGNFILAVTVSPELVAASKPDTANLLLLTPTGADQWFTRQLAILPDINTAMVGRISANCNYGAYYLRDLVNASLYQPEASGWGKALTEDMFAYDGSTVQAGVLWKAAEYVQHYSHCDALQQVKHASLFVADSDEFKLNEAILQRVVGA